MTTNLLSSRPEPLGVYDGSFYLIFETVLIDPPYYKVLKVPYNGAARELLSLHSYSSGETLEKELQLLCDFSDKIGIQYLVVRTS